MRVRVSDFGLAKRVNPLSLLVSAKGTLSFKPPEAMDNMDSPAADVWALGTTLYLLLTDTLPYPELSNRGVGECLRYAHGLRPASVHNLEVDEKLDALLAKCLAPRPEDRYPTAQQLLDDLNGWQPPEIEHPLAHRDAPEPAAIKDALGVSLPSDRDVAKRRIEEAMKLASVPGNLGLAADLLEESINQDPELREEFEPRLKLWRRGICM
jgi:serine/threonine-protein kinase